MNGEYLEKISRAFLAQTGRGLMLAPRDHKWIERWHRAGIPCDVVVQGIEAAFDTPPVRRVNSLGFVAASVERMAKAHRTRQTGVFSGSLDLKEEATASLEKLVFGVEKAMEQHTETPVRELLSGLKKTLESIKDRACVNAGYDLADALEALERKVLLSALERMPKAARIDLERSVENALSAQPDMSPSIFEETRDAFTEKRVREYLRIPVIAVKPGGGWL